MVLVGVRADIVAEVVALLHVIQKVEVVGGLLARAYEVEAVQPAVVDRDLGRAAGVEGIQELGVPEEHPLPVLAGGDRIVDVREAVQL